MEMVLDVSGNSFRNLPNSISKLKNLRLLDLGNLENLGLKHLRDVEPLLSPEVEKNYMPSKCYSFRNPPNSISKMMNLKNLRLLDLWNLWNLENSEYLLLRRELKNLRYLKLGLRYLLLPPEVEKNNMSSKSCSQLEPLLPLEVEKNDMPSKSWRINLEKFSLLPERRDAEHGSFTLRRLRRMSTNTIS